jgi:4-hydroxyphenylpyruvate dioxygenase
MTNEIGLDGIEFIEFCSQTPEVLHKLFTEFGFSKLFEHKTKKIDLYRQGQITFLLNKAKDSFSQEFQKKHGPCVSSMAWRTKDSNHAWKLAQQRGATAAVNGDYNDGEGPIKSLCGIGDSIIYLVEEDPLFYQSLGFTPIKDPITVEDKGFEQIDHLTNNVFKGTMAKWSKFYQEVFEFTEIRYFDIRGIKTGLTSYALKSPCEKFCIPINEGTEAKSQINEYLEEYKGPGVQHIALTTNDIVDSLAKLRKTSIETLDIDKEYYDEVFQRVPNVSEDHKTLEEYNILADGDDKGYILQIFTKNIIGPIFFEIIQRKNHNSFGEGNFGALFRAIERDQEKRGVL